MLSYTRIALLGLGLMLATAAGLMIIGKVYDHLSQARIESMR